MRSWLSTLQSNRKLKLKQRDRGPFLLIMSLNKIWGSYHVVMESQQLYYDIIMGRAVKQDLHQI